jgi:hypothetical protein
MKKNKTIILLLIILVSTRMTTSCDNQSEQNKSEGNIETDINQKSVIKMNELQKNEKVQITDEMIENHIKNDPVKMKEIKEQAELLTKKDLDNKMLNATLDEIFKKNPKQLEVYNVFLSTSPTNRNKDILLNGLTSSILEVDGLVQDIQKGRLNGINVVPLSLTKLLQKFKSKVQEVETFKAEN